ncbi:MAG: hypothetical protein LIP08_13250 [Bacteroides sp.]|nr:hypothetical protein [Bacteroides sp.]
MLLTDPFPAEAPEPAPRLPGDRLPAHPQQTPSVSLLSRCLATERIFCTTCLRAASANVPLCPVQYVFSFLSRNLPFIPLYP